MQSLLNVTVYCLSGTGNSLRAARWFEETTKGKGIDATVVPLESARPERELVDSHHQLAVFVFPTHGFTAPWKMIKFAFSMPRRKRVQAFCAATRGALKFGRFTVPGAAGTAALLIALILLLKGYRLRGITGLDMPSNWMSLYSGFSTENAPPYIEKRRAGARRIFRQVLAGKPHWASWSNAWDLLVWGLPLAWLSALYLLFGRFFLAKLFFATNACTGCGQCAEHCPNNAIIMKGRRHPRRPYWMHDCESCMRCMAWCPSHAVEAGHSWAVILWLVTTLPGGAWALSRLAAQLPFIAGLENRFTILLADIAYFYASLFLSYAVFHRLLRLRWFNELFARTTLTRLYPRYHEPQTSLDDVTVKREEKEDEWEDFRKRAALQRTDQSADRRPDVLISDASRPFRPRCCRP